MGGLRCQKCKNNLRVSMINGMCSKWLAQWAGMGVGALHVRHEVSGYVGR